MSPLHIGFDAKRAYHNNTGLGYYSRTLIRLLSNYYPDNQYYLFNPKKSRRWNFNDLANVHEIRPTGFFSKLFSSAWRSSGVTGEMAKHKINLYHGLSHEIPVGIHRTGTKSVVTIHDLIHERFPEQYNPIDVRIYTRKYKYACRHADHIIAISEQTRQDLIEFYKVPPAKVSVCYQSASPLFLQIASEETKAAIAAKYRLPEKFYLSVGTINDRKNLLNVCKAMFLLRQENDIPLVVIGKGKGTYYTKVKDFILQHDLEKKIIFLSENPEAPSIPGYLSTQDLPAIYQLATAMLYPSYFEGFGAPVLEALCCRLPVITSNVSCLPEAGGDAAYYVNPDNATEIAQGMKRIAEDPALAASMKEKGTKYAERFSPEIYVKSVMDVYQSVL